MKSKLKTIMTNKYILHFHMEVDIVEIRDKKTGKLKLLTSMKRIIETGREANRKGEQS